MSWFRTVKVLFNGVLPYSALTSDVGDPNSTNDFNALWIQEFKKTNAYEVWERVTDPMLFDIVEARYACPVNLTATVPKSDGYVDIRVARSLPFCPMSDYGYRRVSRNSNWTSNWPRRGKQFHAR